MAKSQKQRAKSKTRKKNIKEENTILRTERSGVEKSKTVENYSARLRSNHKKAGNDWENQKKRWYLMISVIVAGVFLFNILLLTTFLHMKKQPTAVQPKQEYWFMLHRKSQKEYFYHGVPGDAKHSRLVKTFSVKTGIPGERPTPLPQLVGKKYWLLVDKIDNSDNPETAPYFLTLNIPSPDEEPYGPSPYTECGGQQCSWVLPGAFGLHGIASDSSRLSPENPGSSGCIRHRDEDITYLYNLLDPKKEEIRYYIADI